MRGLLLFALFFLPTLVACSQDLTELEQEVREVDQRNSELSFSLSGVPGDVVRLDVVEIHGHESSADFFRLFWHTAHRLSEQGSGSTRIELASFGEVRFIVPPDVVSAYGADYPDQNPVYLIRTFPAKISLPNGESAFPKRRGGLLAVTSQQMEDFGSFSHTWILGPYSERHDDQAPIEFRDSEAF